MNRTWYSLLVILVGAVALGFANAAYTNYVQHQSEQRFRRAVEISQQRWCDLLNSLDHPEVPSTTERGKQIQQQIHDLRLGLGCGVTP
jgi:hypothetical protein